MFNVVRTVVLPKPVKVGDTPGKWTVLSVETIFSHCQCVCGKEGRIRNSFIRAGRVTGGCHGCANKRIRPGRRTLSTDIDKAAYRYLGAKVKNAIARCTNDKHRLWPYYGGRGVRIYQEWLDSPEKFLDYLHGLLGCLDRKLVLDRINNNGNYEPGNIRFASRSVSQRNKGPYRKREVV